MDSEPRSYFEFFEVFPNERAARMHFEKIIWQGRPVCPHCSLYKITILKKEGYYRCKGCKKDFTVRTGNIMHSTKIPLLKWAFAMHLMCTSRKGISSVQLAKALGITQKSAWFLLHRIREACRDDDRLLEGLVEVDEAYMGGKERNKHHHKKLRSGRGAVGKTPVFGMRERYDGQIKAFPVDNTTGRTLKNAIREYVKPGSQICSDDYKSYHNLTGYDHLVVKHSKGEYVNGLASTNGIESFWAVLKRGYMGTYHHYSPKHMARYVNEFTFRLNYGNVKALIIGTIGRRLPYRILVQ